ncbi:Gfo/Idh/MocA family protein [Halioxenophilus aromaticivorans]|uniref:Inositol 2-dehydrogenase n=1 Tax=Halioxenophilus aromaticivorans TaxID=1306992 RepID=A0AAV3U372_9ALTE
MTVKIGVIGTGAIGREHVFRLSRKIPGAQVVALNDVNISSCESINSDFDLDAKIFTDSHELIKSDSVDAIVVASWGPTHEEFVNSAISAGKFVFCEKPLAVTAEGCRQIIDAELTGGKRLVQVGFMRRYDQAYQQLKKCLQDNTIGHPIILNCAHRAPHAPGFGGDMAITDSLVHEFDVLRWLLDDDYVAAQVILPRKTSLCDEGLQDPHIVQLRTRQGIHISIESFVNAHYGYDIQCQVVGEKGVAALPEPASVQLRELGKLSHEILIDWKDRFVAAFDQEFRDWIQSIKAGKANGPSAWDGYVVAVTADACVKAKHSGQFENIDLPPRPDFYQ